MPPPPEALRWPEDELEWLDEPALEWLEEPLRVLPLLDVRWLGCWWLGAGVLAPIPPPPLPLLPEE
jgi:hypothetical protein